jgi:hypothetical protein
LTKKTTDGLAFVRDLDGSLKTKAPFLPVIWFLRAARAQLNCGVGARGLPCSTFSATGIWYQEDQAGLDGVAGRAGSRWSDVFSLLPDAVEKGEKKCCTS